MHGKVGDRRAALATELVQARGETGKSQEDLAKLAGVNRNTISDVERAITLSTAPTLRQIADGLATYAQGRRDEQLADHYYERLMRAAGYLSERSGGEAEAQRTVDDLTDDEVIDELERRMGDRDVAVSFLTLARTWRDLDPQAKRMVLEMHRWVGGGDDAPSPPSRRRRR